MGSVVWGDFGAVWLSLIKTQKIAAAKGNIRPSGIPERAIWPKKRQIAGPVLAHPIFPANPHQMGHRHAIEPGPNRNSPHLCPVSPGFHRKTPNHPTDSPNFYANSSDTTPNLPKSTKFLYPHFRDSPVFIQALPISHFEPARPKGPLVSGQSIKNSLF